MAAQRRSTAASRKGAEPDLRARLDASARHLAALGQVLAFQPGGRAGATLRRQIEEAATEALDLARQAGDPDSEHLALNLLETLRPGVDRSARQQ